MASTIVHRATSMVRRLVPRRPSNNNINSNSNSDSSNCLRYHGGKRIQQQPQQQQWLSFSSSSSTLKDDDELVGFLGLGNMGTPMAINLAKSGRTVLVYDPSTYAMSKLREQSGILTADSVQEVGLRAKTIVTMLPSCAIVNQAMATLLEACDGGSSSISSNSDTNSSEKEETNDDDNSNHKMLFVDCSTVSPTTSRYWHDAVQAQGHFMVDAPVSGGVKGAQNATLTFMVGTNCTDEIMSTRVTPLLQGMGQRIIPCGGPGTGSSAKLCNNLALAAQMVGICEAMNLGEALGVDPMVLANVLNTSTAKSWSCEINNPHPVVASLTGSPASKNYDGGFGTKLMLKDLGLAVAAGQEAHVALPIGTATKELYQLVDLHDMGHKDFGVMLQFLRGQRPQK
jgi:3-hydroxyisobutyrate dehydrogenase